jgi:hypothetical protein
MRIMRKMISDVDLAKIFRIHLRSNNKKVGGFRTIKAVIFCCLF